MGRLEEYKLMIDANHELQSFLSHWFEGSEGFIELRLIANGNIKPYFYNSLSQIPIERIMKAEHNIYFGVSTRASREGKKENVLDVPGLWQDLDGIDYLTGEDQKRAKELVDKGEGKGKWKENSQTLTPEEFIELMGLAEEGKGLALKALNEFPPHLQPTFVIDTGKGYQAYWKFREPMRLNGSNECNSIESFNRRLTAFLGADHTTDVSRVFRLPYTRNAKLKDWSLRTEIIEFNPEKHFNPSDFDWLTDLDKQSINHKSIKFSDNTIEVELGDFNLSRKMIALIKEGYDERSGYKSRSEADLAVITALVMAGATNDSIKAVFSNPQWEIGEKYREKGKYGDRYLALAINKARDSQKEKETRAVIKAESLREFLARPKPERPFLIDKILPDKGSETIGGISKLGKSILTLNQAMCLSVGMPFLIQFKVLQPVKVLYIQQEIAEQSLEERFKKMLDILTDEEKERALDNLKPVSNSGIKLDRPEGIDTVKRLIEQVEPKVVMFDPLYKFHNRNENKQEEMSRLMDTFDSLIREYSISSVIVHHHGKPNIDIREGGQLLRGSTTLFDYGDSHLTLVKKSKDEPKNYLKLSFDLRNAEEPDPMVIYRNSENLWFEVVGEDNDRSLTPVDVRKTLESMGGRAKTNELITVIKVRFKVKERAIQDAIAKAVKEGLIYKPVEGGGRGKESVYEIMPF